MPLLPFPDLCVPVFPPIPDEVSEHGVPTDDEMDTFDDLGGDAE